jgi:hypothetical protein
MGESAPLQSPLAVRRLIWRSSLAKFITAPWRFLGAPDDLEGSFIKEFIVGVTVAFEWSFSGG